jgi:Type II intron maturase
VKIDSVRSDAELTNSSRGVVQYYLLAGNVSQLNRLEWVASTSMLKTLAAKHGSTGTEDGPQVQGQDPDAARAAHLF